MIAYIDGGARGNPGTAGFGVYLEDDDGHEIASLFGYLGERTNNVAEYAGLLAALQYAVDNDVEQLAIRSDSELLVKQINGLYRVKNPTLQHLVAKARKLMGRLERITVEHVRREQNVNADRLANMAMDTRSQEPEGVADGLLDPA